MKQDDDNLSFGNNIYHHNVSSSRIIFTNANELNMDSDTHFLREILINSKLKKSTYYFLPKDTLIGRKGEYISIEKKQPSQYRKPN